MSGHLHILDAIAALCGNGPDLPVLMTALFMAGLAGGATHCVGMCGPFVLMQVTQRLAVVEVGEFGVLARLTGAALLPYHLGRATTYAVLGTAAATLTGGFIEVTEFRWLSSSFLLLAAALFVAALAGPGGARLSPRFMPPKRWLAPLFANPRGWRSYLLGVALGFLPCGLLYSALAAAAAGGDALSGALAMAAFTAGTFPALFGVGYGGLLLGRHWRTTMRRAAKPLLAVNAALLVVLALRDLL